MFTGSALVALLIGGDAMASMAHPGTGVSILALMAVATIAAAAVTGDSRAWRVGIVALMMSWAALAVGLSDSVPLDALVWLVLAYSIGLATRGRRDHRKAHPLPR